MKKDYLLKENNDEKEKINCYKKLDPEKIEELVNDYEQKILNHVEEEYKKSTKRSDKIADNIAAFGGSWGFIIFMASFLALWIIWNLLPFTPGHFDPAPFILLNLILSFTAAFQAPIIMMSQNRQSSHDKHKSIINYAINYKAEQEIDDIQGHLHNLESEIKEIKELLMEIKDNQK